MDGMDGGMNIWKEGPFTKKGKIETDEEVGVRARNSVWTD